MTREHPTPDAAPTEPINPLPTPPTSVPTPAPPTIPAQPQSIGDGTGSTDAQPHCTPEQIANGNCDRG